MMRGRIALRGLVLRSADLVLPISDGQAERVRLRDGVDTRRLVTFPVGVSRATYERGAAADVSPRVAALAEQPTVCYLGSLHARRSPELLFAVLEEVARRLPAARFLLVGRITPEAEHHMRSFSTADRLLSTGHVAHEDVPSLLRAARVGIFPIGLDDPYDVYRNSSPLKVMEYMSAGLPVVASRVRDAEKVLGESGGGVCVDNDPAVFAEAIVAYLRDPERARRDGGRGRAYIGAHRLFEVLAGRLEEAYRRLLATGYPAAATRIPDAAAAAAHSGGSRPDLLE